MLNVNAKIYAYSIRRIAAKHQTGVPLKEVKREVDILIQSIRKALGPDKNHQFDQWRLLLDELKHYNNSRIGPGWEKVITHARNRIKIRLRKADFYNNKNHVNKSGCSQFHLP